MHSDPLESALYVSRSNLEPVVSQDVVADIVALSRLRNSARGLTGGLIFTGKHFAQVLEGPGASLDELLMEIANDARHSAMQLLHRRPIVGRFFSSWAMAYNGPSRRVDGQIAPLIRDELDASARAQIVQDLSMLMKEFALLRDAF